MVRFNNKSRNNVKAKQRQKRDSHKDRLAARLAASQQAKPQGGEGEADAGQAPSGAGAPTAGPRVLRALARRDRLAVSGKRTGKHQRKTVRKLQKARSTALESGAVSMEDIIMYASASSSASGALQKAAKGQTGKEPRAVEMQPAEGGQRASSSASGFRVKPSKKARLRLKRRSNSTRSEEMEE